MLPLRTLLGRPRQTIVRYCFAHPKRYISNPTPSDEAEPISTNSPSNLPSSVEAEPISTNSPPNLPSSVEADHSSMNSPPNLPSSVEAEHSSMNSPLITNDDSLSAVRSERIRRRPHRTLDKIIRVDHAGERSAVMIYAGQSAVLSKYVGSDTIKHMQQREKEHVQFFEKEMRERRVRPSLLLPLWDVAGFALGAGTALLGKEAARACTIAVEEVIEDHYNSQLRELINEGIGDEQLLQGISKCRDEEVGHLEAEVEIEAEKDPSYEALTQIIKTGCRLSIWLSERV